MDAMLFLAHRVPYPPNKGDKIRSFNILAQLSKRYRIYLGAFVDDPADWAYERQLREICEDVCLVGIDPVWRKIWSLRALCSGRPLSISYYTSPRMRAWVRNKLRDCEVGRILVFSSAMAQYVMDQLEEIRVRRIKAVLDFVDVDAEKWRAYGERHRWPKSWIYRREAERLLVHDRRVAAAFDANVFVSQQEADLFRSLAPEVEKPIVTVENGVDLEFFSPLRAYTNPYAAGERVLVFTGAMDYWANVDAADWFAREIFPHIRQRVPQARFCIVGTRPTEAVRRYSGCAAIMHHINFVLRWNT